MNITKLLNNISYNQLLNWIAYDSIEPFSERRADARSAQVTSAIVNFMRALGGKKDVLPLSDFMLEFGKPKPKKSIQTLEQQKATAMMIAVSTCKQ